MQLQEDRDSSTRHVELNGDKWYVAYVLLGTIRSTVECLLHISSAELTRAHIRHTAQRRQSI